MRKTKAVLEEENRQLRRMNLRLAMRMQPLKAMLSALGAEGIADVRGISVYDYQRELEQSMPKKKRRGRR